MPRHCGNRILSSEFRLMYTGHQSVIIKLASPKWAFVTPKNSLLQEKGWFCRESTGEIGMKSGPR